MNEKKLALFGFVHIVLLLLFIQIMHYDPNDGWSGLRFVLIGMALASGAILSLIILLIRFFNPKLIKPILMIHAIAIVIFGIMSYLQISKVISITDTIILFYPAIVVSASLQFGIYLIDCRRYLLALNAVICGLLAILLLCVEL